MATLEAEMALQDGAFGCSVTQRIRSIKQPRGGYIKPKEFEVVQIGDGTSVLNQEENVGSGLVGMAVDYLTRFATGTPAEEAFFISAKGASMINETAKAERLLAGVSGFDDVSITNAVKLTGFDVVYRAGVMGYRPVDDINPDSATIQNIRTMVERSLSFFEAYGPKVLDGFTFEGGYTEVVCAGDGDFTTKDTLWDFKVSKTEIKKEHTLQLLMYWRMGLRSIHPEFESIAYLGIYNPRLNTVYRLPVAMIPADVIREVEQDIIGYAD